MGSLFGLRQEEKRPEPVETPLADLPVVAVLPEETTPPGEPLVAPEVDLSGKLPSFALEALPALLARDCLAYLADPEEEDTRWFAVFGDHLEELGQTPVAGHKAMIAGLTECESGAVTFGDKRFRLEVFVSFNEFGDRFSLQFFEEGRYDYDEAIERRRLNVRLVNKLKPATSLTARNEVDIARVVDANERTPSFTSILVKLDLLEAAKLEAVPEGPDYTLRVLKNSVFPRKMAAEALAQYLGAEYLDVENVDFSRKVARSLDEAWELEKQVVPFAKDGGVLKVAMMDPTDQATMDAIAEKTGLKVVPYCSAAQDILVMVTKAHKKDD